MYTFRRVSDEIIAASTTCAILAGLFLSLRLYTRTFVAHSLGFDDLLISTAWLVSLLILITFVMQDRYGLGQHVSPFDPEKLSKLLKWMWISLWTYGICLTCVRCSLVLLYKSVFVTDRFQNAAKVMLAVVITTGLWSVLSCVVICWPISHFWTAVTNHTEAGRCLSMWPLFTGNAVLGILVDLMIIISPLPVLSSLRLPLRQRIGVICLFLVGVFVIAVSIIRLIILVAIPKAKDDSRMNISLAIWSITECEVAIICACVIPIKPLAMRLWPSSMQAKSEKRPPNLTRPSQMRFMYGDYIVGRADSTTVIDEITVKDGTFQWARVIGAKLSGRDRTSLDVATNVDRPNV